MTWDHLNLNVDDAGHVSATHRPYTEAEILAAAGVPHPDTHHMPQGTAINTPPALTYGNMSTGLPPVAYVPPIEPLKPAPPAVVWLVMQNFDGTADCTRLPGEACKCGPHLGRCAVIGAFASEADAARVALHHDNYGIGPVQVGHEFPEDLAMWEGYYYPYERAYMARHASCEATKTPCAGEENHACPVGWVPEPEPAPKPSPDEKPGHRLWVDSAAQLIGRYTLALRYYARGGNDGGDEARKALEGTADA